MRETERCATRDVVWECLHFNYHVKDKSITLALCRISLQVKARVANLDLLSKLFLPQYC